MQCAICLDQGLRFYGEYTAADYCDALRRQFVIDKGIINNTSLKLLNDLSISLLAHTREHRLGSLVQKFRI